MRQKLDRLPVIYEVQYTLQYTTSFNKRRQLTFGLKLTYQIHVHGTSLGQLDGGMLPFDISSVVTRLSVEGVSEAAFPH